jgi:hypothetical protein
MAEVVTFVGYRPPVRYDGIPWTRVRIQEAAAEDGSYTQLEEILFSPVDTDPSQPQTRSFTTELGTAIDYWYRVVFADATGDTSVPTTPVQNIAGGSVPTVSQYVDVVELARVLQLQSATPAQATAMLRAINASSAEIDSYLAPDAPFFPPYPALVVQVCLERAVYHWKAEQSPFGIVALGGEAPPGYTGRNSWRRHANALLPLKTSFGLG